MSVFLPADNDAGYVQAVIVATDFPEYEKLGFVKSADDVKSKTRGRKAADNGESHKG
ncbi:hypothetical protein [Yokenella regensburgei]|uniref:hypothetical protein n=1 Tax=Yokenella regensburgei TaxID=158877 RepID=UPI003F5CBEE7